MRKSSVQQQTLPISTGMSRFAVHPHTNPYNDHYFGRLGAARRIRANTRFTSRVLGIGEGVKILLNVLVLGTAFSSWPVFASPLPRSVNLNVPFTVQAPFANWDHTHEEACEEAVALMVNRYWDKAEIPAKPDPAPPDKNQKAEKILPREAEEAIQNLVAFQKKRYGFFESTTAEETARFIKDKWRYAVIDLIENPTLAQIKRELAAGFPIIVPAAGRSLGNPNFKRPGPLYHMLVIKGYTADGWIITNDPGTRRGGNYRYRPNVLLKAIHDWNGGKVDIGRKVMIVVRP